MLVVEGKKLPLILLPCPTSYTGSNTEESNGDATASTCDMNLCHGFPEKKTETGMRITDRDLIVRTY
jgi:hypothetical protein